MYSAIKRNIAGFVTFIGLASASAVQAQSVAPMSQKVVSFGDVFLVQFEIRNTYETAQINDITLYTSDWKLLEANYISQKSVKLGPNNTMVITAMVPFSGEFARTIYVCNSILPRVNGTGSSYKGEVCGKVYALRLQE